MLDGEKSMTRFLNLIAAELEIARVPVMVDSSKWSVIEPDSAAFPGKPIVNSLSLKKAKPPSRNAPNWCFATEPPPSSWPSMKKGQARLTSTSHRNLHACLQYPDRGSRLPAEDIIFDPNVLTVATGIEEPTTTRSISSRRPAGSRQTSRAPASRAGISNISFSFPRQQSRARSDACRVFSITPSGPDSTWVS